MNAVSFLVLLLCFVAVFWLGGFITRIRYKHKVKALQEALEHKERVYQVQVRWSEDLLEALRRKEKLYEAQLCLNRALDAKLKVATITNITNLSKKLLH